MQSSTSNHVIALTAMFVLALVVFGAQPTKAMELQEAHILQPQVTRLENIIYRWFSFLSNFKPSMVVGLHDRQTRDLKRAKFYQWKGKRDGGDFDPAGDDDAFLVDLDEAPEKRKFYAWKG